MFYYRDRDKFEEFIDDILDRVRLYRMERSIPGTDRDDLRLAKAFYMYKRSDPCLALEDFLARHFHPEDFF